MKPISIVISAMLFFAGCGEQPAPEYQSVRNGEMKEHAPQAFLEAMAKDVETSALEKSFSDHIETRLAEIQKMQDAHKRRQEAKEATERLYSKLYNTVGY